MALAHQEDPDFEGWPLASIRVLRALAIAEGRTLYGEPGWIDTAEVEAASDALGEPITYPAARNGCRWLVDGGYRWTRGDADNIEFAEETAFLGRCVQRLTEVGRRWAAISFELLPWGQTGSVLGDRQPPDPVTPLWRVLTDTAEVLVIAADAPAAIALYEQTTGEDAHRAEAVDTTAPLVVGWSKRKRE